MRGFGVNNNESNKLCMRVEMENDVIVTVTIKIIVGTMSLVLNYEKLENKIMKWFLIKDQICFKKMYRFLGSRMLKFQVLEFLVMQVLEFD